MPGSMLSTVDTALTADESLVLRSQHSIEDNHLIATHLPWLTLQPNPFLFLTYSRIIFT